MSIRATLLAATSLAVLGGLPAQAQAPDFGQDTSAWANDGECDDPRFEGPGMAATTLDADIRADATDCRTAYEAGTVQLAGDAAAAPAQADPAAPAAPAAPPPAAPDPADPVVAAPAPAAPAPAAPAPAAPAPAAPAPAAPAPATAPDASTAPAPVAPVKGAPAPAAPAPAATAAATPPAAPTAVNYGDDSSEWANDGECDDRRFAGAGMATSLSWIHAGRDATDCRTLADAGSVRSWSWPEALAATQCEAIDFGDDSGEYARDGECDDPRFEGLAMASGVSEALRGRDASDCRQLCTFGAIALRDY